jgi:isonocardicin synthase
MADVSLSELAAAVSNRRPERLDEPLEREPYDLFVARTGGFRWVGRKVPTEVDPGQAPAKSCLITASMIAGLFDEFQISAAGVRMYFRPLDDQERGVAFAALVSAGRNDIQYPITRILADGLTEVVFAHDFWKPTPERVRELDVAEAPLRRHAVAVLDRYGFCGGRIYDPACSTGTFLAQLRHHYPGAWTIGQDLNPAMVDFARERIDEVHCGDSISPAPGEGTIDVLVLRHLNLKVVTTAYAHEIFNAATKSVAKGGLVLVMGHTPVLISPAYFEQCGFTVLERLGVTPEGANAFQFYVLRNDVATS